MRSYRCGTCKLNWPPAIMNKTCPACGRSCWTAANEPNQTPQQAGEARGRRLTNAASNPQPDDPEKTPEVQGTQRITGDYLHAHRVERFQAIGFSELSAERLALAKDKLGFPIYWGRVKQALDAGCTLDQALAIWG